MPHFTTYVFAVNSRMWHILSPLKRYFTIIYGKLWNPINEPWERMYAFSQHLLLVSVAASSLLLAFSPNFQEIHDPIRGAILWQLISIFAGSFFCFLLSVADPEQESLDGWQANLILGTLYRIQCWFFLIAYAKLIYYLVGIAS